MKIKVQLVDNWRQAWRWISVNCMLLAAAVQGAWVYVPDDMRASVPRGLVSGLTLGLLALGIAGRLIKQGKTDVAPAP